MAPPSRVVDPGCDSALVDAPCLEMTVAGAGPALERNAAGEPLRSVTVADPRARYIHDYEPEEAHVAREAGTTVLDLRLDYEGMVP